ncbi:TetR/AcrR family transcriptional regulator [Acidisoma cellulosilytica]|uniref:TetR/AcrR family transcriptional regulator n=1 Tax=Acidisoma cellulosilyticum TaxID=2802395 RepID=A0A964E3F4_9PROT|nr:TetR/AcrR family transcriptional regulator [Acidisoma cellulosilyticum]MCB8880650.1 TetR/AcrR family transcriptional regulator [Acidisoma cellulosilyticum]
MSSQNTNALVAEALLPKRQRGRDRVDAILAAAIALFAEKDYEAVTMTEIAAQSSTAIGSLYRFFPTKDVLVAALLERYGATLSESLAEIVARASLLSPEAMADALVAMGDSLRPQRTVTLKLIDFPNDSMIRRQQMRDTFKDALARILSRYHDKTYATDDGAVLLMLGVMKSIWSFVPETDGQPQGFGQEARRMIALYLADLGDGAAPRL